MNLDRTEQQITFLSTRDMTATHHFYTELLGLKLVLDQGGCRIYQVTETSFLGFCERDDAPTKTNTGYVVFTFVLADVDASCRELEAKGVVFTKAPAINERYQIYNAFFKDPNGYTLEIQRFLKPFP